MKIEFWQCFEEKADSLFLNRMASSYSSEEVDFYKELDDFELQLPGRGKDSVPFSANQVLLEMLQEMYPDWEEEGKVTSVPVARIPQQFLHNRAMCKKLEERLKSTQKGELGEQKLYRLFAHGNFDDQPGVIIFPNLNCSHLFRTQVAKVEIDLLLVHQRKGVFIFNVKTVGGKCSSEELRMDILKQRRLIELLIDYKPDKNQGQNDVPIHSIICNFLDDSKKFKCLEEKTDNVTLVFNKIDLDPAKFPKFWADKINDDEIKSSIKSESALKVLVARLVALSSIKKSAAAIHQNMKSGFLQAYAQPTPLETQISAFKSDKTFEDLVMKLSETVNQNGKKKFILWTKEQMDTIAQIYDKLMNPVSENGMRVLVEGCKGSGKTLLLIFITKLAQRIFRGRNENGHGRIMVFVGCRREGVLIEQLRAAFIEEWREIVIRDNPCKWVQLFTFEENAAVQLFPEKNIFLLQWFWTLEIVIKKLEEVWREWIPIFFFSEKWALWEIFWIKEQKWWDSIGLPVFSHLSSSYFRSFEPTIILISINKVSFILVFVWSFYSAAFAIFFSRNYKFRFLYLFNSVRYYFATTILVHIKLFSSNFLLERCPAICLTLMADEYTSVSTSPAVSYNISQDVITRHESPLVPIFAK